MVERGARFFLAMGLAALAAAAQASETTIYAYDELGRLIAASSSGTVNDGIVTALGYDPAGNRATYVVSGAGGGTAPPPPSNNPPTPANDGAAQERCTTAVHQVVANDTDPDGDYPLALVAVAGDGFAVDSATGLEFTSGLATGARVGTYTVRDSRGATATATLTVLVSGGTCL